MGLRAGRTIVFLFLCLPAGLLSVSAQEISGRIQMEAPYPPVKVVKVQKKRPDSCAAEQMSQGLLVSSEGGVANTVLWLEGDYPRQAPAGLASQAVQLNQSHCNFEPHIVLIPPGGHLEVVNSDPLAHDVRAFHEAMMLFRLDMDTRSKPQELSF